MSTLENIIWHILGYSAMPFIFIVGFIGVALLSLWVLSLGPDRKTAIDDEGGTADSDS